jgi:hypothetical protein
MDAQKRMRHALYSAIAIIIIGGLAYLPNIQHFGYFNDDWYLMYAANAAGADVFKDIYRIDRPARAIVMSLAYSLFGLNPLYYNLSAFFFRVVGALAFLWILRKLWPGQRTATTMMSLLFLIYPGFLSTPNAIDYQSQQISLCLAFISIAASLQALISTRRWVKSTWWLVTTLTAGIYLSLVEYFLGLEVLRVGILALLEFRKPGSLWQKVTTTLMRYLTLSVGTLGFLVWRFFFFESARKATDLGAQLAQFSNSPIRTLVGWGVTILQDSFEATFLAWGVPLSGVWSIFLRLREMLAGGLIVLIGVSLAWYLFHHETQEEAQAGNLWYTEATWLGLVTVIAGFLPVAMVNREANFFSFSRYMLASAAGAVIFLTGVIFQFKGKTTRLGAITLLVTTSLLTHHLNGILAARRTEGTHAFWWQVYWRIPQIQPGTTLVANYSHAPIEEEYLIWGPANLIYHPQSVQPQELKTGISSIVLTRDNLTAIQLKRQPDLINRRSILVTIDYGNILILTQPTSASCVQVLDGRLPLLSEYEQYDIILASSASNVGLILLHETTPPPPEVIFGPEPQHEWCFYYEKASLAYQQGDWHTVIHLGQKARKEGLSAADPVEWLPFIQAAALIGDREELLTLAPKVKRSPYVKAQACHVLSQTENISAEMKQFIETIFCAE